MWKFFKSYFWWDHPRGSFHYDVMVTLILAFIFISPRYINFRDQPAAPSMHPTKVGSAGGETEYLISAAEINAKSALSIDEAAAIAGALKPFSGNATVDRYDPLRDSDGNIAAYRVFVRK